MRQRRKYLLRFFAALAATFLTFNDFLMPAYAGLSTVDTYFEQHPEQLPGFAAQLNIAPNVAAPIVPVNRAVSVTAEVLDASGKVIATTFNGTTTVASGTKPFLSFLGGSLAAGATGAAAVLTLQDIARNKYCSANSTSAICASNGQWETSGAGISGSCTPSGFFTATHSVEPSFRYQQFNGSSVSCIAPHVYLGNSAYPHAYHPGSERIRKLYNQTWNQISETDRNAITNGLNSEDYRQGIKQANSPGGSIIPAEATHIRVTPPSGESVVVINSDGQRRLIDQSTLISLQPEVAPDPSTTTDTDKDGIPDSQDPDDDNDGVPDTEDPDDDNDGLSDEGEVTVPQINSIEASKFQGENWLQHGIKVFSTKFPFDILGNLNTVGTPNECPKYIFFNHTFELCPIRDMLSILKVPALIAFLVWAFFSI